MKLEGKKKFQKCPKCRHDDFSHEGIVDMSEEFIQLEIFCTNCETTFYEFWEKFDRWEEVIR